MRSIIKRIKCTYRIRKDYTKLRKPYMSYSLCKIKLVFPTMRISLFIKQKSYEIYFQYQRLESPYLMVLIKTQSSKVSLKRVFKIKFIS